MTTPVKAKARLGPDTGGFPPSSVGDDPGFRTAPILALVICVLLTIWMVSGMPTQTGDAVAPSKRPSHAAPIEVSTMTSTARPFTHVVEGSGTSVPARITELTAPVSGRVTELYFRKGDAVAQNDLIARFDATQVTAELARARAGAARAQMELDVAETLFSRNAATRARVSQAKADHLSADADVKQALQNLSDTEIRSPFAGQVEALEVVQGATVQSGASLVTIVDLSSVLVRIQVPQETRALLRTGMRADIRFGNEANRAGEIVFLGTIADTGTRRFQVEVLVPNATHKTPAGIDAKVSIAVANSRAHFIAPEYLSLNETGALGLKIVGANDQVAFAEVDIIKSEASGIWVNGLPDQVQFIAAGRGMVTEGDLITPKPDAILANALN